MRLTADLMSGVKPRYKGIFHADHVVISDQPYLVSPIGIKQSIANIVVDRLPIRPPHDLPRREIVREVRLRLGELDLRKRVGRYLSRSQIDSMLRRRDAIVGLAATLVAQRGEDAVLYP